MSAGASTVREGPLVSIVTPSLNQGRFIRDALASVAAQDYPYVEHIVVDGLSNDDTAAAVAPYLDRITWISEHDRGQTDALNKGFRRARGEILAWLNADDLLLPSAVSRVVETFEANPTAGLVYGAGRWIDENGRERGVYEPPAHWGWWELVNISPFVLQPAAFFSRAALDAVGPLRPDLEYTMDWDLFIRIAARFPLSRVGGAPLAEMRLHESTKSATGGLRRYAEIVRVAREHAGGHWPPLVASFGVETLLQLVRRGARLLLPELDSTCAPTTTDALARLQKRLCGAIDSRTPAIHSDGWAGKRLVTVLPPGTGEVVITGVVPEWIGLRGQRLRVHAGAGAPQTSLAGPGEFTLRIACDSPERPLEVAVDAERCFVPARAGLAGGDTRRLAWRMLSLGWANQPETALRTTTQ